jgi:hypothetical protein
MSVSAVEVLNALERGGAAAHPHRALALAALACPGVSPEAIARLTVGQRDACLVALRERLFGPAFAGLVACPGCGEQVECVFAASDIRTEPSPQPSGDLILHLDGREVRFRLPTGLDLMAIAECASVAEARRSLLARCLLTAEGGGAAPPLDRWSGETLAVVVARMEQADPQADVRLALTCPSCAETWQAPFDIVSFLWSEIRAWAERLLEEVHALASAYGWSEGDILALSPWRRQCYLNLVAR